MQDKKTTERKPYTKPAFQKLTPRAILSRLAGLATARGRDLLSLVVGLEPREVADVEAKGAAIGQAWIGVDLDGTLAEYNRWIGMEHIGKPVPKMKERVKKWLSSGKAVKIVTARVSRQAGKEKNAAEAAIRRWAKKYIGRALEVTAEKDFDMAVLYDDRAVCVRTNKGTAMRWQDTGNFEADMIVAPPIDTSLPSEDEKASKG